ncbi:MAG TPA: flagellar filament capping protein FliD [Terracidiphilus sp.]|nr:flagellar filament capping protein FliD [Terracidiphilus sp.]
MMGTVGLNFGSPTSGAGFDVSTTVAQIVGNLQNVETPWKNQLTQLQSQDTAISSLGTLLSSLSNDMSSLTNPTGILAQKAGSSSDTNVLTLTAATSAAVAGTHTVEVGNLATTSSGYLTQIANANDTLAGSITLQAGSGTPLTITLDSSSNTLAKLAATINASGVGINASVLTDTAGSRLSLVSATSGAGGNIAVSSNTIVATDSVALSYTDAGTTSTTAPDSGTLTAIANASDTLTGSLSIKAGTGTAKTIVVGAVPSGGAAANTFYTGSGVNTLSGLEGVINLNSASLGVTASLNTVAVGSNAIGTILTLTSNSNGSSGALTVNSSLNDNTGTTALAYANPVSGADANLTVDGVALTSASNTVANLIPGVTFQLLAPSATNEHVQVVIANDNTDVESTVSQMVSDYNALIKAVNTQEGNDSSGKAEPLFGSPTLSLLQQQLLGGLNMQNPNGFLTAISANTDTTLAGSLSIQVGSSAAQIITVPTTLGNNTISGLASAINSANIGVTANVVTSNGQSTLALASQTAGSGGALTVNSSIVATSDAQLSYSGNDNYTSTTADSGTLTEIANASDALTGSISIQVGHGTAQTISVPASPNNSLSGLRDAINSANIGVSASVVQNGDGSSSLSLLSGTVGSAGALTVTSNVLDTTNTSTASLNYTKSSDINSLTSLGISVNNDGSISFDASTLDSLLNSDYSSVAGFFQNANSWGQTFSTMLTNAGNSSSTGILSLSQKSNSNIESTLNAEIAKEDAYISAQQKSLTTELNTANQIMEAIPNMLDQVNELYSAITGYNQNING